MLLTQMREAHEIQMGLDIVFEVLKTHESIELRHRFLKSTDLRLRYVFGQKRGQFLLRLEEIGHIIHHAERHVGDHLVNKRVHILRSRVRKRRKIRFHRLFRFLRKNKLTRVTLPLGDGHDMIDRQLRELVYLINIRLEICNREQFGNTIRRISNHDCYMVGVFLQAADQGLDGTVLIATRIRSYQ